MPSKSTLMFGVISVFLIVVIICMTVFSVLSLSTANADNIFAQKSSEAIKTYYAAEADIQELLIEIDDMAKAGSTIKEIAGTLNLTLNDNNQLTIVKSAGENRNIHVLLSLDDGHYAVEAFYLR